MMSEKRFECVFIEDDEFGGTFRRLKDNETGIMHMTCDVVDLLNFQNTQIKILKEENEQLRQFITKGRRLSVKELMENTNENELLKKKIMELEKENKELQTELDSFRPVIFHTMQRGTITLYTNTNL